MITRDEALDLLRGHDPAPHLIQHALASEAVMHGLAAHFGENIELWGLVGLLHDIDYPLTTDAFEKHGLIGSELLEGKLPEEGLHAIRAHNEATGTSPSTRLDFALRCGETVTGLITAAALVRPTGVVGMEARSLKKKMKDKAFAASVNRDCIRECSKTGLELDAFLELSIKAMEKNAEALGLLSR